MPGMIVEYQKKVGDSVKTGDTVLVIEAMKMNNNINSPCDGVIKEIPHKAGDSVAKGDVLVVIGWWIGYRFLPFPESVISIKAIG